MTPESKLTPAHERVLRLVLAGKNNPQIVEETHWSAGLIRKMVYELGGREKLLSAEKVTNLEQR